MSNIQADHPLRSYFVPVSPIDALYRALIGFTAFAAAYIFILIPLRWVYRAYFDELSHIPGPKSELFSGYFGIVKWYCGWGKGTQLFIIRDWHKVYGPLVRVGPKEVHINDIDAYNQIFKVGTKYPKTLFHYNHPTLRPSVLCAVDFQVAHQRRAALQPYFSKQAVRKVEYIIQEKVDLLLERIASLDIINLSRAFRCLACDVITSYSYDTSFKALEHPEFAPSWLLAFERAVSGSSDSLLAPRLYDVIAWAVEKVLPRSWVSKVYPDIAHMLNFNDYCGEAVLAQKKKWKEGDRELTTIFGKLFEDDPKTGRKAADDRSLIGDAVLTVAAGMDTTGHALVMAIYHLIRFPETQDRLLDELRSAMPLPLSEVREESLEHLPYLQAVIKEALRFSHGTPGPLPRDVPAGGATICGQFLPGGTMTSNSHYIYHTNEVVFPRPFTWNPDRWFGPVDSVKEMEKYFMPFSRGGRICIGMNLAWTELSITLARIVRRFDLSFAAGFKDEDMMWLDYYLPVTKGDLKVTARERVA